MNDCSELVSDSSAKLSELHWVRILTRSPDAYNTDINTFNARLSYTFFNQIFLENIICVMIVLENEIIKKNFFLKSKMMLQTDEEDERKSKLL